MKLRQLQFIREVASNGLSVSAAAVRLHTSQPSVSRQIRALETELGATIFERDGRRITGITRPGREILEAAERVLNECDNVQKIGSEHAKGDTGTLTVAASHTHARYVLPKVIQRFTAKYPRVRLSLRQGNPGQIAEWLGTGDADICIGTEPTEKMPNVVLIPCSTHYRIVIAPASHPLAGKRNVTLAVLARYPIITYDKGFSAYTQIMQAFQRAGLEPNIVLTATDVDVMKTYVRAGLGVAIVSDIAYSPAEDRDLRAIDVGRLFESSTVNIGVKRGGFLPFYAKDFIDMFAPKASRKL